MTKKDEKKPSNWEIKCIEAEKKYAECEEKWLRCSADLQNVRRRAEEDRLRFPTMGKVEIIKNLLPTLDHAELALKNIPQNPNEWESGVIVVLQGILPLLRSSGLEKIDAVHVSVDPNIHEVLMSEGDGSTVVEILQSGWRIGEVVIRAAKVRAGDKKEPTQ